MRAATFDEHGSVGGNRDASRATANSLPTDEVDIWCVSLDEQSPSIVREFQALLSTEERARAERFHFDRDRHRYVVGRGILRRLLGWYLDTDPAAIRFQYGPNGKPAVEVTEWAPQGADTVQPFFFNLAHSEERAVFAFTRAGEVGIDVERMRDLPDFEAVAISSFSARELKQFQACAPDERRANFFRAWTRQEAVLKAIGRGLGGSDAEASGSAFRVRELFLADGFAAAIAVSPQVRGATIRPWTVAAVDGGETEEKRGRRVTFGASQGSH